MTKNKLFVTDTQKPTPPAVGKQTDNISIKEVSKIDPQIKLSLGKSTGICISTDADLQLARSLAGLNVTSRMFGIGGVLSRLSTLPTNVCPLTPASLGNIPQPIDLAHGLLDTVDHLQARFDIGSSIMDLCKMLEVACPTCLPFPDLLDPLNIAKYHAEFSSIIDRVIDFGDSDLFEMMARCPEYLMQSTANKMKDMADRMSIDGQLEMFKTLTDTVAPEIIADIKRQARRIGGQAKQNTDGLADFNDILTTINVSKEDLVTSPAEGLDGTTVFSTDQMSEATSNGSVLYQDTYSVETIGMINGLHTLVQNMSVEEKEDSIPGTWQDELGYIHITGDPSQLDMSAILLNNRVVRQPRTNLSVSDILDLRIDPQPIDLNGCAQV